MAEKESRREREEKQREEQEPKQKQGGQKAGGQEEVQRYQPPYQRGGDAVPQAQTTDAEELSHQFGQPQVIGPTPEQRRQREEQKQREAKKKG